MDDLLKNRELVSALADGQLRGAELARAVQLAATDPDARLAWHAYHLAGDVLRSAELASSTGDESFMARLSASLAEAPVQAVPAVPLVGATPVVRAAEPAANESSFRWKMVAGFASIAAVGAIGWSTVGSVGPAASQPQIAAAPVAQDQTLQPVTVAGSQQVMIRDTRLDELMSAHRQFGGTSALQMPAGFLRNATFESPGR